MEVSQKLETRRQESRSTRYVWLVERADLSALVTILGKLADALDVDPTDLIPNRPIHQRPLASVPWPPI